MKQFLSFVKKEFYHVFRDKKTLLLLFGLPIVQIVLFGFALTNEIKNAEIAIFDLAHDPMSHQITERIKANSTFLVRQYLTHPGDIEQIFKSSNTKLVVVFPSELQTNWARGTQTQIQVIADASDPNTAQTLSSYINLIVMQYQSELTRRTNIPYQIVPEVRMIYNPELKGATNFVPGVMSLVLLLICMMMTSVSIVKEKESGTMEVLLVSPFNPFLVIISKTVPYLLISILNLIVILLLSVYLLGVDINGNVFLLMAESTLFIITALSMGLLISSVTESQQTAMLISILGMLVPAILLTGFMFPIENMPIALQWISNIIPSKWYYIIVKSVMIKGLGLASIWKETLILMGMTLFLLALSLKKFKTHLE